MFNTICNIVIVGFVMYLSGLLYLIHEEQHEIKIVKVKMQCPSLPSDYFVIRTKEEKMCIDYSGASKVYKEIESAVTIK